MRIKLIKLEPAPARNPGKIEMGRHLFDSTPVGGGRGWWRRSRFNANDNHAGRDNRSGSGGRRGAVPLSFLDTPFVLIINTAPDEYYFAANGSFPFRVSPNNIPGANIAAAAIIERGAFRKWPVGHPAPAQRR